MNNYFVIQISSIRKSGTLMYVKNESRTNQKASLILESFLRNINKAKIMIGIKLRYFKISENRSELF